MLLITLWGVQTSAQSLLSVTSQAGAPVIKINPATGTAQTVISTGAPTPDFGLGTFDPLHRRLFFLDGPSGSQSLIIVDLNALTVTAKPIAMPASYLFLEYDAANDRVLSVTSAASAPIVSINPSTGATLTLLSTGASSPDFGLSAFDPIARRLYFLDGPIGAQSVVTLNLATQAASTVAIPIPANYLFFEWDSLSGRILAVTSQAGGPLLGIDPATGASQTILTTGATNANFGLSAIDTVGRRLFFLSGPAGAQSLFTVNLSSNAASSVPAAIPASYLLFEFEPLSGANIPALESVGLMVLALGLAFIGIASGRFRPTG